MNRVIKNPEETYEQGLAQQGPGCVVTIGPSNFRYRKVVQLNKLKNVLIEEWQPATHDVDSYQSRNLVDLICEIPPEFFVFTRIDYYPFWPFGFELSTRVWRRRFEPRVPFGF